MAQPRPNIARALPRWVVIAGSVAIGFHLFAVGILVVAARSGQWPTPFGPSMAEPPPFAATLDRFTTRYYLQPLRMTHNYHFVTNRPGDTAVYLEVRLKDKDDRVLKTVKIPDPNANSWVRHRQHLLAQALADDIPIQARPGEVIQAPHKKPGEIEIWDSNGPDDKMLHVRSVPEHRIPRDRPVARPSPWSLLLARSYVRHLCREYGAEKGELIRHSREAIMPAVLFFGEQAPPGTFDELVSNFGELPR